MSLSTKAISLVILLLALLPLSNGLRKFSEQQNFQTSSAAAMATVVAFDEVSSKQISNTSRNFYPVVEFTNELGDEIRARTNVGSYPPAHAVGDRIPIRYHLNNPADVRNSTFAGRWFEPLFYLIPGVLTLLLGAYLYFRSVRPVAADHFSRDW